MKKIWITLLVTIVVLASGFAGVRYGLSNNKDIPGETKASAPPPSRRVVVEKLRAAPAMDIKTYPGTVKASSHAGLAFRVGGPLIRMEIKPGDRVKKNQLLMEIDPQDFRDRIRVLETSLKGALARLENGRQDYVRVKSLFDQKVIPRADFDHAKNGVDTLKAGVDGIRAQLIIARHQLAYTALRAPFDGIITQQLIENHEMVAPGQVVVKLHNITTLEIEVKIPENEMVTHTLKAGEPAVVRFPSLAGRNFSAAMKEWNTRADRATRTYAVTFTMPAPEGVNILPGMTAEISWDDSADAVDVITIPAKAVVTDSTGKSAVWIFDPSSSTAGKKSIQTGRLTGSSRMVVDKGLKAGDLIVVQGMDFITRNMKLTTLFADGLEDEPESMETIQ